MNKISLFASVALIHISFAHAQTTLPALPQVKAKVLENPKFVDTSGLTDIRLRAERGSLSRYSVKASLGFQGPVIDDLSNPYQPDFDQSVTHNPTLFKGSLATRYRWSPESVLGFGTGLSRVTPFVDGARTDVSNPFVSFDHSDRLGTYQLREAVEAALVTNPEMRNCGQVGQITAVFILIGTLVSIDMIFLGTTLIGYGAALPSSTSTRTLRPAHV